MGRQQPAGRLAGRHLAGIKGAPHWKRWGAFLCRVFSIPTDQRHPLTIPHPRLSRGAPWRVARPREPPAISNNHPF